MMLYKEQKNCKAKRLTS
uniref:Uncharacterized protein n=1 Tax=Anguilla anguilla TaxID=7936 RepID=A0A0E9S1Q7_ANGAN